MTRLVRRWLDREVLVKRYSAPLDGFARKFTPTDVALLAETDALHGTLSGPATKYLMQRAFEVFGEVRYERLASLSVARWYHLRHGAGYEARRLHWTKNPGLFGSHRPAARPGPRWTSWFHSYRQCSPRR